MIASSWRESSSTIIQNCFRKAGFKHHAVDPAPETEEDPLPAPAPDVWNRVQRWLGDVQFDEFAASEPEAATAQPMSDQDIVNIVLTENDAQDESDDESEEEIPSTSTIKTSVEFLAMIDQQKAFLKRNEMPTEIVEQLEAQVVAKQFSLCSKQKQMQDYFQSSPRAPTPSKEPRAHTPTKEARAPTPIKDVSFKIVADVTKDVSLVDSLDMDDMELESIDTTIASVAASALMKETPTRFLKVHNKISSKLISGYFILIKIFFIKVVFHYISFQNVTFQYCRLGQKKSVYFCLINDFYVTSIISLWKFTNFLSHLCERIILITPIAFFKIGIIIIKIKCLQIQSTANIILINIHHFIYH